MGKILIIPEKPSVARDIAAAVGGFSKGADGILESATAIIIPARGHLVELSVPTDTDRGWGLAVLPFIPPKFTLAAIEGSKSQLALIGKALKRSDVDVVVNACDAGREGELIFRYIYLIHGCKKTIKRMWLRSMTEDAIADAYHHMRDGVEFDSLFQAAQSRSEADWLIGINGTRAVTSYRQLLGKSEGFASAGRVQTPVLAMLYDREMAIKNFVPRDFWEIHGDFSVASGSYSGKWFDPRFDKNGDEASSADRLFDSDKAKGIADKCRGVNPSSITEESIPSKSHAPKLYDLTTLQREANTKLGFTAKATLEIAQSLYEKHKVLSYPRTDSSALPEDYIEKSKTILASFGGTQFAEHAQRVLDNQWVKPNKRIFDNSKISDHFAITPTGQKASGLTDDERKIYDLVVKRFIAIFHPAAEFLKTTRITLVQNESFKSLGSVLISQGWLAVYGGSMTSDDDGKSLCRIASGETGVTDDVRCVGMKTKAPEYYTDATLLAAMEHAGRLVDDEALQEAMKERGLGTPATRAATIEDLLSPKKLYMQREKKYLRIMTKGIEVIELLRANGIEALTSPQMTGEWEFKLALMEKKQFSRAQFMEEARAMTTQIVDQIRAKAKATPALAELELTVPCPKCQGAVIGQGLFYLCTSCSFKMWREVAGYSLSTAEAEQLIAHRETPFIDRFVSAKTKNKFTAKLVFDEQYTKASFVFPDQAEAPPAGERKRIGTCPKCQDDVIVNGDHYDCVKGMGGSKTCDFRIWGLSCGKKINTETAEALLRNGRSGLITGFKSKAKKVFSAVLVIKGGKVEFEFEKNI